MHAHPTPILTSHDSPFRSSDRSAVYATAHSSGHPAFLPDNRAPAADAASGRRRGQVMQSLVLPRPTSLLSTPFGRHVEPEDGLAKFRSKFSPARIEQHSYPSPPMSEPHSPSRRPAQTSEAARHSYPPSTSATQRLETGRPLPPPSSSLFDPHSASVVHGNSQQRSLYSSQPPHGGQPLQYQPGRSTEHHAYSNVAIPQSYGYAYPGQPMPPYPGAQHGGPMAQQAALIAPPASRPSKPARRTKAHVASACVNCKKAHLSCDVQRPCGRCVASGKQVSLPNIQL